MTSPLAVVKALDHLVLTCSSVSATTQWYTRHLGFKAETFTSPLNPSLNRVALKFGQHKINLHQYGKEFEPKAQTALPGTADLCFIVGDDVNLEDVVRGFRQRAIEVLEGGNVVPRTGANGKIRSIYVRDLDGNLIE